MFSKTQSSENVLNTYKINQKYKWLSREIAIGLRNYKPLILE